MADSMPERGADLPSLTRIRLRSRPILTCPRKVIIHQSDTPRVNELRVEVPLSRASTAATSSVGSTLGVPAAPNGGRAGKRNDPQPEDLVGDRRLCEQQVGAY
jgi:hypothetical protein